MASVSLRGLHIAAVSLTSRREQEEILVILDKISKEAGWRVAFMHKDLKEKWGWDNAEEQYQNQQPAPQPPAQQQPPQQQIQYPPMQNYSYQQPQQPTPLPPAPPAMKQMLRAGIVNPLLSTADFSQARHPYQEHYVAPNPHHFNQYNSYNHYS